MLLNWMKRILVYLIGAIIYGTASGLYAYFYGRKLPLWILMPAVLAVVFIAERVASRRDSKANAKKINVEQIYEKTCREAAGEIGRGRYREAIEIFSKFAEDHPFTHEQEIKGKISALKSLIQKQEEADEESKTLESEEEKRS